MSHVEDAVASIGRNEALDGHRIGAALAVGVHVVLVDQNGESDGTGSVLVVEETRIRGQATDRSTSVTGVDSCHVCFLLRMARVRSSYDLYQ